MSAALWLPTALRHAGLPVTLAPGWEARGRPSGGGLLDIRALICHHTAGLHDLSIIVNGRAGLEGPLAQLYLARTGVFTVVAAGKSNSNGQVSSEDYSNAHTLNVEAEALGTGDASDWPKVQYDNYAKGMAALALYLRFSAERVRGHKEIAYPAGRKIDPSFDMMSFRAAVARDMDALGNISRDEPRPRFVLHRMLSLGSPRLRGADVRAVQHALIRNGIALPGSLRNDGEYDGIFGPDMDLGVRRFQRRKHLAADGIVGPITTHALGGTFA